MATDGPERSGSALGFPVPSITTCVRDGATLGVGVWAKLAESGNDISSKMASFTRLKDDYHIESGSELIAVAGIIERPGSI